MPAISHGAELILQLREFNTLKEAQDAQDLFFDELKLQRAAQGHVSDELGIIGHNAKTGVPQPDKQRTTSYGEITEDNGKFQLYDMPDYPAEKRVLNAARLGVKKPKPKIQMPE